MSFFSLPRKRTLTVSDRGWTGGSGEPLCQSIDPPGQISFGCESSVGSRAANSGNPYCCGKSPGRPAQEMPVGTAGGEEKPKSWFQPPRLPQHLQKPAPRRRLGAGGCTVALAPYHPPSTITAPELRSSLSILSPAESGCPGGTHSMIQGFPNSVTPGRPSRFYPRATWAAVYFILLFQSSRLKCILLEPVLRHERGHNSERPPAPAKKKKKKCILLLQLENEQHLTEVESS